MEWFYADLAGIRGDPAGPGFKKIIIQPQLAGDLKWVRADFNSVRGKIISHWQREGDNLTLNVTVPPNTTATVYVPTTNTASVSAATARVLTKDAAAAPVNSQYAADTSEVKYLRAENGAAVFAVAPGRYSFTARLNNRPD